MANQPPHNPTNIFFWTLTALLLLSGWSILTLWGAEFVYADLLEKAQVSRSTSYIGAIIVLVVLSWMHIVLWRADYGNYKPADPSQVRKIDLVYLKLPVGSAVLAIAVLSWKWFDGCIWDRDLLCFIGGARS